METKSLLSALQLCKGAIEAAAVYPIFGHFCFFDDVVYAYNDIVAVMVPLESGLTTALRADVLLGVLPTLAGEMTLTQGKDKVILKSGKVKVELAALPSSSFLFEPPEEDWQLEIFVTDDFFKGLARCAQTVGDSSLHREFTGVTFSFEKSSMSMNAYSSDDVRLSRYTSETTPLHFDPKNDRKTWLLPARACTLIADIWQNIRGKGDEEDGPKLCFGEEWVMFSAASVLVYSKLMPEESPDYAATLKTIIPKNSIWQPLPEEFKSMAKRAECLVARDPTAAIELEIKGKNINAALGQGTGATLGSFEENITLEKPIADLKFVLGVSKLNVAVEDAEEVMFSQRCLGLRSGEYTCWISPVTR